MSKGLKMRKLFRWALYLLLFVISIALVHMWISNKEYLFDRETIFAITKKAIAKLNTTGKATHDQIFDEVAKGLEAKYKTHILPKSDRQWLFVNAGGWMASFYLMHASLTEYVYFMGTAMQTSGHAGRHWLNISDIVVGGEFREWTEGTTESIVLYPGDTTFQLWGTTVGMDWKAGTWVVEYGRGISLPTLMVCLADTLTGTTDVYNLYKITVLWGKAFMNELLQLKF